MAAGLEIAGGQPRAVSRGAARARACGACARGPRSPSSTWTRSSPATRSAWRWRRSSRALRPFGMGNPAVNAAAAGARACRRPPDGRGQARALHGRSAGVRRRVRSRSASGDSGLGCGGGGHAAARRRRHGWRSTSGAARSSRAWWCAPLHPEPARDARSRGVGCAACALPRPRRAVVGRVCFEELDAPLEHPARRAAGRRAPRTVVDRRGCGCSARSASCSATGESLLVACADVLAAPLAVRARARAGAVRARGRAIRALDAAARGDARTAVPGASAAILLRRRPRDASSATRRWPSRFTHVFALDPPPFAHV